MDASSSSSPSPSLWAEALANVVRILVREAMSAASTGVEWSRQQVEVVQARNDLNLLYTKLGKEVFALVNDGGLDHPVLTARAERIRKEIARVAAAEAAAAEATGRAAPSTPGGR